MYENVFLEISQNLQENNLCQSLIFNKVADLGSCEFYGISKNTFFTE